MRKLHLAFCVWCDLSYSTHTPQAKFCSVECSEDHRIAKRMGKIKEMHAAAMAARRTERAAHNITAKTVTEAFGEIFGLEWAP